MLLIDYIHKQGWQTPRIEPFHPLELSPANLTLHYGQAIFEGMKAFLWKDGSVNLMRPTDHLARFARSAEILCMPEVDSSMLLEAIETLIDLDRSVVPDERGTALYIRPTLIANDGALGVRPSNDYLLFVITSPVGAYYARGMNPVRILVEEEAYRVAQGGLGEAKASANYAASLRASQKAREQGFDQVLWLDAHQHKYVEEVGTMNIFFVIDDVLVTPSLDGTILSGITRQCVLELAAEWGIKFEEREVPMQEVVTAHKENRLQECFGSGTAAVISQVGELFYKNESIIIDERPNSLRERLYKTITGIQYGELPDEHGWMYRVRPADERKPAVKQPTEESLKD
jgi:branched-chain amino acid aminotransferase